MATTTENLVLHEGMSEGLKLQVSKVIRAKRERVFEAWTKPEIMQRWFGPEGMSCNDAKLDVRVGGEYRIEVTAAATGKVSWASGVYQEVVPNELLRFTWLGCWRADEESVVTVSLRDVEGGTEVTITHERVADAQGMAGYEQGWTGSLTKLERLFNE